MAFQCIFVLVRYYMCHAQVDSKIRFYSAAPAIKDQSQLLYCVISCNYLHIFHGTGPVACLHSQLIKTYGILYIWVEYPEWPIGLLASHYLHMQQKIGNCTLDAQTLLSGFEITMTVSYRSFDRMVTVIGPLICIGVRIIILQGLYTAEDRDRWRTLVNAVMNLRVP